MKIKWFVPAIIWFIISTVLLTLPGDDLPHSHFFDIPFFDKWVHLIMFFLLTTLFAYPFIISGKQASVINNWFIKIVLLVIAYGVIIEFVQKNFTKGRSFDLTDIIFDSVGSLLGYFALRLYSKNKIGPDGNQGRNQN